MRVSFVISSIINYLFTALFAVIGIGLAVRFYRDRFSKKIRTKAEVIDKYAVPHERYGKSVRHITDYTVAFDCGARTEKFFVSFLVYDGLEKGDRGVLTYRGSHFISFEQNIKSGKGR